MIKKLRSSPSGKLRELPPPSSILWATDGSGDAATWDEVTAAVDDSDTPITVWLVEGGVYQIPSGVYDVRGMSIEAPRNANLRASLTLTDGAHVKNLGSLNGAVQCFGNSSADCLSFDGNFGFLRVTDLASIENQTTTPMIVVTPGNTIAIHLVLLAALRGIVVNATGGIFGIVVNEGAEFDDGFATGAPGAAFAYIHDGSILFPTSPGFGTIVNIPFGQDGGYGPTTFRPQGLFQPVKTGCAYWDTTLGKMIWYNGTIWVDAAGVPV